MYSTKPKRLPIVIVTNHDKEIAVAISGLIPISPKNRTKAPSLTPRPEIDMGRVVNKIISGRKIRQARKGILQGCKQQKYLKVVLIQTKV
jgi:hypothetical protein